MFHMPVKLYNTMVRIQAERLGFKWLERATYFLTNFFLVSWETFVCSFPEIVGKNTNHHSDEVSSYSTTTCMMCFFHYGGRF